MGLENSGERVERRAKRRFVMEREIRYRVLDQDKIIAVGCGKTLNLSSNGVAFVTDRDLPMGAFIEVSIAWPALLENRCPLQLIGFGRVLRSAPGSVAVTLEQYEFRTLARAVPESAWSARSDQKLRRWAEAVARG
ncbi:MAG TPA: PilZ domain-containing protein [Bryobacteraceae bacterium]|nr:PilZ domain-containing protein [Bryobacteraceae bacterium]